MSDKQFGELAIGLAFFGAMVAGVLGLIVAVVALFSGEFLAAGTSLIGAALAFGLSVSAVLRR